MTTRELTKKTREINRILYNAIRIIERNKNEAIKIQIHLAKKQDLSPIRVKIAILKIEMHASKDQAKLFEDAEKAIRELIRDVEPE